MPWLIDESVTIVPRVSQREIELFCPLLKPAECLRRLEFFGQGPRTRACDVHRPPRVMFAVARRSIDCQDFRNFLTCIEFFAYQAGLIRKKLDAGQEVTEILTVNAAPGYSEHHSGRAVDIASPGSRPLTEEFEASEAFGWLEKRAKEFDFSLTYPRDNRYGFVYEPWHWSINS